MKSHIAWRIIIILAMIQLLAMGYLLGKVYPYDANFNFGNDTYEKVDNLLIVNSLGDETKESQFKLKGKNLGYNDYIPENAFKNNLYNEGYSKVYDFKPSNKEVTEIGYMGRKGDPRAYDKDYVLTSEYEKYSSPYQDIRIKDNKTNIKNNKGYIVNNSDKITTNEDNIEDNSDEIYRVENESKDRDDELDDNIGSVDNNSRLRDKKLDKRINDNTKKIDDIDSRVNELEETQKIIGTKIRVYDNKKWKINVFADYSTNRKMIDRTGVSFTYKLGKSYEEKQIEKLKEKIKKLEETINR